MTLQLTIIKSIGISFNHSIGMLEGQFSPSYTVGHIILIINDEQSENSILFITRTYYYCLVTTAKIAYLKLPIINLIAGLNYDANCQTYSR